MAYAAAPLFFADVIRLTNVALLILSIVIELAAFGHCLLQRTDAFAAIGTLSKGIWLALTGGAVLVTLLSLSALSILGLIAITVAAIYLLDIRPALRDAVDGHGPW
jgi:hypothetical protein